MLHTIETNNKMELLNKNHAVKIYVSHKESSAVHMAVENLLRDIGSVCG